MATSKFPSIPPAAAGKSTLAAAILALLAWQGSQFSAQISDTEQRLRAAETGIGELRGVLELQREVLRRVEKALDSQANACTGAGGGS